MHKTIRIMKTCLTYISAAFILGVGCAYAEEAKKPQIAKMEREPAQEKLGKFAGTWKTRQTINFGGEEATVEDIETYSWMEPTGVWLMKQVTMADHPIIGPMNGVELWAYDARTDEIVRYWFDSQSTESFPNRGNWTDDSTLLMTGMIVWEGRNMYLKNIYAFDGPDKFVWTHYQSWDTDDSFVERARFEYTRAAGG